MNFDLPVRLDRLQNDRLWLVPLEECSTTVIEQLVDETGIKHPKLWEYFPRGPFTTADSYMSWYNKNIKPDPSAVIFAIFLKAGTITRKISGSTETLEVAEGTFAGTTGLTNASSQHARVEMGFLMVLPEFQRTFVNTHASCLLLKHLLDPISGGDLGLRRVQWQANSLNKPSIAAAERLGFTLEGIMRWERTQLGDHKKCVSEERNERTGGLPMTNANGGRLGAGRHSAMLSMCWDDWLEGHRERALGLLI